METIVPFPPASAQEAAEAEEAALTEVEAAIALVLGHVAIRVRLAGLRVAEAIAGAAAARAQAAGVGFRLDRYEPSGPPMITIGPAV
jgi:hypothetical protein